MAVLSDYTVILDHRVTVTQKGAKGNDAGNFESFMWNFHTGGQKGNAGVLIYMVRGLTDTNDTFPVFINSKKEGDIIPYVGFNNKQWFTQIIHIKDSLKNDNLLRIDKQANREFFLTNMICFFKQDV